MFKKILFFFLIISPFTVYADNFFPEGKLQENRYMDTLMFGIGAVPDIGKCPGCVEYDINGIEGSYSDSINSSVNIDDITYLDSHYGLVRVAGLYDSISLPPNGSVDFIYLYRNDSNQSVNITRLGVFLTRDNGWGPYNLLDTQGEFKEILFDISVLLDIRAGNVKTYDGIGIVNRNATGSIILDRVYVKSPLIFTDWEVIFENGDAHLRISVYNQGDELLNNVEYKHREFSDKRNFSAKQSYTYEYILSNVNEENIEYPSIFNPNIKSECAVSGQELQSIMVGNSAIVYGIREENGLYLNYISSRVKPWVDSFCITRIPYRLYAPLLILKEEEKFEEGSVLGVIDMQEKIEIEKLPQTNVIEFFMYLPLFLVVIAILCYYLNRRFK